VPLLCRMWRADQMQVPEFLRGVRSHFRAGLLPASH